MRLNRLIRIALIGAPFALIGLAQAPAQAAPARAMLEATAPAPLVQDVQYRRERRCWVRQERVRFRDRYGRVHVRVEPRRVCAWR
ncbi:MAG TPA: hypothetical protein VGM87_14765 [Roseomonas sp.]|jgi:hypothetical protein